MGNIWCCLSKIEKRDKKKEVRIHIKYNREWICYEYKQHVIQSRLVSYEFTSRET